MSEKQDYYELLGVPKDCDAATLKKAFRAKALKYHPDRNDDPGAEESFKAINEAYLLLSDPEKRARYDRYGHSAVRGEPFTGTGFNPADLRDLFGGDLFEELFGAVFRRSPARHGRDLKAEIKLSLEEVACGVEKQIRIHRNMSCDRCRGSGARKGSEPKSCSTCRGKGQVRVQRGFIAMAQVCPGCHGTGQLIEDPCSPCGGQGSIRQEVTVTIPVPPGVETGHKLRLDGEGEPGRRGGQPGDLYVQIQVKPHPFFEREGPHLHCEVPISFPQAALGASIEVPTLDGKVRVKVPAGTQSGKSLRLRSKGLPNTRGRGGDLFVKLQIETPKRLSPRQRELLEEFEGLEIAPGRRSFLDTLKDWFS